MEKEKFVYDFSNDSPQQESNNINTEDMIPDGEIDFVNMIKGHLNKHYMLKYGGKLKRMNLVKNELGL